jgi:RHS repeat-associated protein
MVRASAVDDATGLRAGNDNPELYQYYYHSDHLGSTSLITNLDGEVVQHVEYVPFGEVFIEERNNKWNTPYLFNAKELDEETGLYYYGARYYDARVSLWLGADPMQEKYPNVSTYAYCLLNPVKLIDPDGRDYTMSINRNKDDEITSIAISVKVYITGAKASEKRADELNKLAKSTFASKTINKVKVSFNIKYEYSENITTSDLKNGENILNFTDTEGRSSVKGIKRQVDGNSYIYTGRQGTIYSNGDNKTVMHETGHLIGLADRYDDVDGGNLGGRGSVPDKGFEKDLMGSLKNSSIISVHYQHYIDFAKDLKPTQSDNWIVRVQVGVDKRGRVITPFEEGGHHEPHPFSVSRHR